MNATLPDRPKTHVLVFPCGSEPGTEVYQSLRYSLHVKLFGASSVEDHGQFRFENYVGGLPFIHDSTFDVEFSNLISSKRIDVVFATHDSVAAHLAERAGPMGFFLVNGDPETTAIVRRKSKTYQLFADQSWAPAVYEGVKAVSSWPVVAKPDRGQGGIGVIQLVNAEQAQLAMAAMKEPVLVEYLPGDEITIDCFTDRLGNLIWVGARTRERVRAGITMRSRFLESDSEINAIASTINCRLRLRGPWFFQLKRDRLDHWKLLEIACRVAGTMAAQRARGVNLPLMAIHDYLGRDLKVLPAEHICLVDRAIATRAYLDYEYDSVFVDLDDTLIIDGHVVPQVVHFLFQSRAAGKRLILITRHEDDCLQSLEDACISQRLFDDLIHIKNGRPKSDFVTERSIFIDNHFPERVAVFKAKGVPVLDVDALEFLLR